MAGALPVPPRGVPGTESTGSSIAAATTAVGILGFIIHGTGAVGVLVTGPWIVEKVFPAGAVKIAVACVLRCGTVAMLLTCHISTSGGVRVAGLPAAHSRFAGGLYHYKCRIPIFQAPVAIVSPPPFFTGFKRRRVLRIRFFRHELCNAFPVSCSLAPECNRNQC